MMLRPAIAGFLMVLALAPAGHAAGPRDHEPGFFLRLSAGFGGAKTERDVSPDFKLSGVTGDPNFAIGGTVTSNLALHGTLWGWSASEPTFEVGGVENQLNNTELTLGAFGIGVTYYFMPVNLYISPSIGVGSLTLDTPGGDGESDTGVVFDFTVGKEWWVSDRWALGVAGAFGLHSIPDNDSSVDWQGSSIAVRFTSTFN